MTEVTRTARANALQRCSVAALQTWMISMISRRYANIVKPIIIMQVSKYIRLKACSPDSGRNQNLHAQE